MAETVIFKQIGRSLIVTPRPGRSGYTFNLHQGNAVISLGSVDNRRALKVRLPKILHSLGFDADAIKNAESKIEVLDNFS